MQLDATQTLVDVTAENAQTILIDTSFERPVLVDFWADWCEPCKVLMPVLEKLAAEYQGRFLLARVNADELGPIAGQLGVRSLPTLMLMDKGQPVDGLVGAQPEQAVRALLDKHLPPAWLADVQRAEALMASEAPDAISQAVSLLKPAWESGRVSEVGILLADCQVALRQLDAADAVLQAIPMQDRQGRWQEVLARLTLKREAGKAPEVLALEQAYVADPHNLQLAQQLATALVENQHGEEALGLLFGILERDLNAGEGAVKKCFQDITASLGKGNAAALRYQRKLYALLY